jgi:predicted dehydrogenase
MSLRVGILGTGGIGARHAAAAQTGGFSVVAACGRDTEKAAAFSERFGATAYTDFARMLGETQLDLLVVALPPYAHSGQVEAAAQAGVNLLVEKPIALDLGRAEAMIAASAGVTAACGFMYRHGDAVQAWERIDHGRVGHFAGSFHSNALHAPWWRERDLAGGQMVEQLIHIADLARHSLGMPRTIYAKAANLFHRDVERYTSEDVSAMVLGYEDGRIGVLHASNAAIPGRWMKGWQVIAERATGLFFDWNTAEIVTHNGEAVSETIKGSTDPFVAQLVDVAEAIRDKRPPLVPLRDGLDTLRIVLAARRSADEGREVVL